MALVAVVSLLLGTATTLVLRTYLAGQLDRKVQASLAAGRGLLQPGGQGPGAPPADRRRRRRARQRHGTVDGDLQRHPRRRPAARGTGSTAIRIRAAATTCRRARTIDGRCSHTCLRSTGLGRVPGGDRSRERRPDSSSSGCRRHEVDSPISTAGRLGGSVLVLAGIAAAGAAPASFVVRRQLRPLREVAATAHTVAELPLASGEIELAERVPERPDRRAHRGRPGRRRPQHAARPRRVVADARHESEQQVRQFVADASHELRTPLTTIAGYTELARRRPDDVPTMQTALGKVEEESARMTAMVEDLLLLARLDSGRPLERGPVDLSRMLVEAVSDARVVAPDHKWQLEVPEESIEVDRRRPAAPPGRHQPAHQRPEVHPGRYHGHRDRAAGRVLASTTTVRASRPVSPTTPSSGSPAATCPAPVASGRRRPGSGPGQGDRHRPRRPGRPSGRGPGSTEVTVTLPALTLTFVQRSP